MQEVSEERKELSAEWQQYKPEDFGTDPVPVPADPEAELRAAIEASLAMAPPLGPMNPQAAPLMGPPAVSLHVEQRPAETAYNRPHEGVGAESVTAAMSGLTLGAAGQQPPAVGRSAAALKPDVSTMLTQMVCGLL